MCLCTSPSAKCKPTERAKSLGKLVFYIMIVLVIVLIVGLIGGVDTTSLFAIGLVITGWCGVKDDRAYDIEQIMCVVFFSGYLWVYSLVNLILYLVDNGDNAIPLTALFGGVLFYAFSCYFAKLLYDELRLNYQPPGPDYQGGLMGFGRGGMMGRMMGGGMRGGAQQQQNPYQQPMAQQQQQQPQQYQSGPDNPPPYQASAAMDSNRKFQAFQGTGHTLG